MPYGNDDSKEKDGLRPRSRALYHWRITAACPSLEMVGHGSVHLFRYALRFKREFLGRIP